MENKDKPAYPLTGKHYFNCEQYKGLTKLEEFTKAAMQGLCASPVNYNIYEVSARSIKIATETLKQLENGK